MDRLTPFATPGAALARQAETRGEAEALVFPEAGRRMTYRQWHDEAVGLARGLVGLGIGPGDHVGILAETRIEWPVIQLAIAMAGAVAVPLNTHYRRADLGYALRHSRTCALFLSEAFRGNRYLETVSDLRGDLPDLERLICIDRTAPDCIGYGALASAGRASARALPAVTPDAIGSLQYTSGTTGFPKGALLTHAGMLANAWGISGRLGVGETDRWTSIIPLFHCAG